MKRNSLGWWLAAINVAIVLLVAAGISYFAVDLLRGLADSQQKTRVQLAGANARAEINRFSEDALSYARLFVESPILKRLLYGTSDDGLPAFLRRNCVTEQFDACAVVHGSQVVGAAGVSLPWGDIITAATEQGDRFMVAPTTTMHSVLGAISQVSGGAYSVIVVRLLDAEAAKVLSEHNGLEVSLINYRAFNAAAEDEFTLLHSAALADGRFAVQRIDALGLYASSFPVFAPTGEGIALIETRASSAETDEAVAKLVQRLLLTAAVFALAALVGGVALGWRVTRPTEALNDAAIRLGQGDFATSIPTGGPAEIGQLGRTMDDMRRNLVDLTGELRQREAQAQAVLDGIVEGVVAIDTARVIRYLNPQAAKLLGAEVGDVLAAFNVATQARESDGARTSPSGGTQAVEQVVARLGDRHIVVTSSRMTDGLQVLVLRDETELEGVRRARDTVLANISHEFRTPLAAQLASIELLRDGLASTPPAQLEELVLSLERGTLRLTRLIDNLLESVRIESGQIDVRRQTIAIGEVVDDARGLVEALLQQRRQPLEIAIPEELTLQGDAPRLTQVFVNLIANASKFAPEGTAVRVGAEESGENVVAWVEDAGPGLPEGEDPGNLFERFRRGGAQEPEPGGLGLGLWITRSIVERHGGSIAVRRTDDGLTRFTLTLPREPKERNG
jgi:signal transduction histidine kinase/HAMP domain-containing protein